MMFAYYSFSIGMGISMMVWLPACQNTLMQATTEQQSIIIYMCQCIAIGDAASASLEENDCISFPLLLWAQASGHQDTIRTYNISRADLDDDA